MKKKSVLLIAALAVVVLVLIWLRYGTDRDKPTSNDAASGAPIPAEHTEAVPRGSPITSQRGSGASVQPSSSIDTQASQSKNLARALQEKNVPVDFYGRVVDQDSNALAGVKIELLVRHWDIASLGAPIAFQTETDSDGRFHVQGVSGDAFDIEALERAGYELEPNTRRSYGALGGSVTEPVVFKMWSTNINEHLSGGQKSFQIEPDGRPYFINLKTGAIAESGAGDLRVSITHPRQVSPGQAFDWRAELNVINGGLIEETDPNSSMYLAPATGYTNVFQYAQQIKGGQRGSTGSKRFFLTLNEGREYGRLTVQMFAPYNAQIPGLIRLEYAINPSGSRVLR